MIDEPKTILTFTVTADALFAFKDDDEMEFYSPAVRVRMEGEGDYDWQLWPVEMTYYSHRESAVEAAKPYLKTYALGFKTRMEDAVRNLDRVAEPFKRSTRQNILSHRYMYWRDQES